MIAIQEGGRKASTEFDEKIANVLSKKKLDPIVTELFICGGKLYTPIAFIIQS